MVPAENFGALQGPALNTSVKGCLNGLGSPEGGFAMVHQPEQLKALYGPLSEPLLAVCRETELGKPDAAPEWVHLLPIGPVVQGQDGRAWTLDDPARLVAAFNRDGTDLVVDYEHQEDDPARRGNGPVPAAGWIKELRVDPARGLMGRVEWTATARQLIANREYRFLSPVFLHDRAGHILRLRGASLVHRPNLTLTALARQEIPTMPENQPETSALSEALRQVAEMMGLPPGAEPAAILSAVMERLSAPPDPARFVPVEAVREMMAERALNRAAVADAETVARVDRAITEGYMPPALRKWGLALCRQDPQSFDGFIAGATPVYAHLSRRAPLPALNRDGQGNGAASAEEAAVFAQLGLDPKTMR